MLGVPAQVAGCKQIIVASPPGPNGHICPEVEYIAEKVRSAWIPVCEDAVANQWTTFATCGKGRSGRRTLCWLVARKPSLPWPTALSRCPRWTRFADLATNTSLQPRCSCRYADSDEAWQELLEEGD